MLKKKNLLSDSTSPLAFEISIVILIKNIFRKPPVAKKIIKTLLRLHNFSYKGTGFLSQYLEPDGLHPKHRIMKYHDWFTENVDSSWTVIDIGCGNGALTFDIGSVVKKVIGVDFSEDNIRIARERYKRENLDYVFMDVTSLTTGFKADCIVLSNVLEHIKRQKEFH